jgi:hypothetical protein
MLTGMTGGTGAAGIMGGTGAKGAKFWGWGSIGGWDSVASDMAGWGWSGIGTPVAAVSGDVAVL